MKNDPPGWAAAHPPTATVTLVPGRIDYGDEPPAPDELPAMRHHVVYELTMFGRALNWAGEQRSKGGQLPEGDPRRQDYERQANAYIESAALHARNLVEFFFKTSPYKDDVYARLYLPTWEPGKDSRGQPFKDALDVAMRPFNKRILHITAYRERIPPLTEEPDAGELHRLISELWESFRAALDDEQRDGFDREFSRV